MSTIEELRQKSIDTLNFVNEEHYFIEIASLVCRLEDTDTVFVPGKNFAVMESRMAAAYKALNDLANLSYDGVWDEASEIGVKNLSSEVREMAHQLCISGDKFNKVVTFPMVLDALRGSWRDDKIYNAVSDLQKAFSEYEVGALVKLAL